MAHATNIRKKAMLRALEKSLGIVSIAAKEAGIERKTHYNWIQTDRHYKIAVEAIEDIVIDFAESKLHTLINEKDTAATIFLLKCKGKKRGYIEKTEVDFALTQLPEIILKPAPGYTPIENEEKLSLNGSQ